MAHLIELDEAVSRIKQACDARPANQPSPFFFMIGAGISYPSVPLAEEIVSQCKTIASQYGRSNEPKSKEAIDRYSHWFETAFGEPNQRQGYLRKLIEEKQITHANFRLAHLLLKDKISNVVVTTNFDDFLSKALTLFGKRHILCDHPQTVGRINYTEPDLQIVHLHGSYWFYDCCNLGGEIQNRSQQSPQTTSTMASLLDMILWNRSPLVIGYSGWEGDVFMNAFQRRLANPLGSNAYWFVFRRDQLDSMPNWLKNHSNVRFVVSREAPLRADADSKLSGESVNAISGVGQTESRGLAGGKDIVPSLPADRVLDALIRAFDLDLPELTKDPLQFFANQLERSLPKDEASDKDADIYAIKNVIERVKRAKQKEIEESNMAAPESWANAFEEIRDALRRADYRQAIKFGSQLQLMDLSVVQLDELSEAAWLAASKLYDNSDEEIAAYDLVVAIADRLSELSPSPKISSGEQAARALTIKGFILGELNRNEEALRVYDEVAERYGDAPEAELRKEVAKALVYKGVKLVQMNRFQEALGVYEEVEQRYGAAPEVQVQEQVASALVNKGLTLGDLNRSEEALRVYDEMVQRYGNASAVPIRAEVARALVNKGYKLGQLNRRKEALAVYDEVLQRYSNAPEAESGEPVIRALVNKGHQLSQLNQNEEALLVYDEVVQRYGDASDAVLREGVARALVNKAGTLGEMNRNEEVLTVVDDVMRRYGDASEMGLRVQVAKAALSKGLALKMLNRNEEAITIYDQLNQRFGDAPELTLRQLAVRALFNKGVALGALNRTEEELDVYNQIVQRHGDAPEPVLRRLVANVLNTIGFRSIIIAKAFRLVSDENSAKEKLRIAEESLARSNERDPDNPMILGNQAYLAFLTGRKEESLALLRRAISLGGEVTRDAELADADINRLPEDDEFCEMVRSIPLPPVPPSE